MKILEQFKANLERWRAAFKRAKIRASRSPRKRRKAAIARACLSLKTSERLGYPEHHLGCQTRKPGTRPGTRSGSVRAQDP